MAVVAAAGLLMAAQPAGAATVDPHANRCSEYKRFVITAKHADLFKPLGAHAAMVNTTGRTTSMSRSVSFSGSDSLAVSASVGVDAGVLLATVKTQVSATATRTMTVSDTITGTMSVRAHHIGYLQGGILRLYDTGRASWRYDDCGGGSKVINIATPHAIGIVASGG